LPRTIQEESRRQGRGLSRECGVERAATRPLRVSLWAYSRYDRAYFAALQRRWWPRPRAGQDRPRPVRTDGGSFGAHMQLIRQMIESAIFARIAFVEYLAHLQLDRSDERSRGLHHCIARHVGRTRLFDLRLFGRGQFRRLCAACDKGREHEKPNAARSDPSGARDSAARYRTSCAIL
jgi:hypothetical protein